ncbi:hypothetical protein FA13DRAFT_1242426 [Coprinellus micaceus]|jgi:chromosome segregation ATPase|uniref:Uncharacterized protein n=1 Tax=Coprinellus micaceus TaxID=71717 RepID=A0A4Y7TQQ4_COPMI|nr:hypothetical protein FA13DRAFT_1242426 [Coprinellus micaceus]
MIIPLAIAAPPSEYPLAGYTITLLALVLFGAHAIVSAYRMKQLERELKTWRADLLRISSERKAVSRHKDAQISTLTATVHTKEREINAEIWKRRSMSSENKTLIQERERLAKVKEQLVSENEILLSENEKLAKQKNAMAEEREAQLLAFEEKTERLEKRILALKNAREEIEAKTMKREAAWTEERARLWRSTSIACTCGADTNAKIADSEKVWAECASKDDQIQKLAKEREELEVARERDEDKIVELTDKLSEYRRRLAAGGDHDGPSDSSLALPVDQDHNCPSCYIWRLRHKKDGTSSGPWDQ